MSMRVSIRRIGPASTAAVCTAVADALPDDLAPRLADTYLALKAAGRL